MTHKGGVNSDGEQEVKMKNKSLEETVQESLYCTDLEPGGLKSTFYSIINSNNWD